MRNIMDLRTDRGRAIRIIDGPASVDCEKEVKFCCTLPRSFKYIVELLMPCFYCKREDNEDRDSNLGHTVTGTIFGRRKGRVSLCIQENSRSPPILLLELSVPTSFLAKEMQYGLLRIALECDMDPAEDGRSCSLLWVPRWRMYCNGRKVGFAARRQATEMDMAMLRLMCSVSAGAGVIPGKFKLREGEEEGEFMYMRASYQRVVGSQDSESFHLINPGGSSGQELSIFLLRS